MIDTKYFKEKLEGELALLENEMKSIGRRNPSNPADWEAVKTDLDSDSADENEVADEIEEYEENSAIIKQEETQYNLVKAALKRIADGTYGKCKVGGEEIEVARLEANPSAETCIEHAK
ncbi:MAG: TraR/DksA C4-type zinc finger protein [Minisyncoccia bacterium]